MALRRWILSLLLAGLGPAWSALAAPGGGQALPELPPEPPADSARQASGPSPPPAAERPEGHVLKRLASRYRVVHHKDGTVRFLADGYTVVVQPDGGVGFLARSVRWDAPAFAMVFDVTDAVMRRRRQDPYAAEKLAFLGETRPWRLGLRQAWRERVERDFFAALPGRLRSTWARTDLPPAARRARIFELWDECLEASADRSSQLAQQARGVILQFVRTHLPAGSPAAFTLGELSRYRQRRGPLVPFDPYGPPSALVPTPEPPPPPSR
jgi:hypothetical protein